jgi:hypothetical protein
MWLACHWPGIIRINQFANVLKPTNYTSSNNRSDAQRFVNAGKIAIRRYSRDIVGLGPCADTILIVAGDERSENARRRFAPRRQEPLSALLRPAASAMTFFSGREQEARLCILNHALAARWTGVSAHRHKS